MRTALQDAEANRRFAQSFLEDAKGYALSRYRYRAIVQEIYGVTRDTMDGRADLLPAAITLIDALTRQALEAEGA